MPRMPARLLSAIRSLTPVILTLLAPLIFGGCISKPAPTTVYAL